jgi:hypothetical protein
MLMMKSASQARHQPTAREIASKLIFLDVAIRLGGALSVRHPATYGFA